MGLFDWLFGRKASDSYGNGGNWAVSENGNPMIVRYGKRITVFPEYGGWTFCIADASIDDRDPFFSGRYTTLEAAKYEAIAALEDRPATHKTSYEERKEINLQASRDYVASRRIVLNEIKWELAANPGTVSALRKIERKLTSSLKALPRMRDEIYVSGADDGEVEDIDRLISAFQLEGQLIERVVGEMKARPRSKRPPS